MRRPALVVIGFVALLLGSLPAVPASAEPETLVRRCGGQEMRRCVWLNFDPEHNRYRAWGSINDVAGGLRLEVAVNRVRVYRYVGGDWQLVPGSVGEDLDGYHASEDIGAGALVPCSRVDNYYIYARAEFEWRGQATGSDSLGAPDPSDVVLLGHC